MSGRRDDAPEYRLLSERRVMGRRDYACAACNETIPAGTRHWVHACKLEGEFRSERTHGPVGAYPVCPRDVEDEKRHAAAEMALMHHD